MKHIFLFILLALVGCTEKRHDGVNVGNGYSDPNSGTRVTYASPFRFLLSFPEALQLTKSRDEKRVVISNHEDASRLIVTVSQPLRDYTPFSSSKDIEAHLPALHTLLEKRYGVNFSPVTLSGLKGFVSESRLNERVRARYGVLTETLEIVEIEIDAIPSSSVSRIIHTFLYDAEAPVVMRFDTGYPLSGAAEDNWIYFHAFDEYSGISLRESHCGELTYLGLNVPVMKPPTLPVCGRVQHISDDLYGMEVTVNRFRPSGEYLLTTFHVTDRAGNVRTLRAEASERFYRGTVIPVAVFRVRGTGIADFLPPVIHEMRIGAGPHLAGTRFDLMVRATDDISGIAEVENRCWPFVLGAADFSVGVVPDLSVCGAVRPMGGDWYAIKVTSNPFRPSGTYSLAGFGLSDRAGNRIVLSGELGEARFARTNLMIPRVEVRNPLRSDVEPPEILEFKADGPFSRGKTGVFRFRAIDDVSGLDPTISACGAFELVEARDGKRATLPICGEIRPLAGEWYSVEIPVSAYRPGGTYRLTTFEIRDLAENTRRYTWDIDGRRTEGPPGLDSITIQVR